MAFEIEKNSNYFSIQNSMDSVSSRFAENKLTMEMDKSEIIFFGSGTPENVKMSKKFRENRNPSNSLDAPMEKRRQFKQHIHYVVGEN